MEKSEKEHRASNKKLKRSLSTLNFPVVNVKKSKVSYELEPEIKAEINKDRENKKLWDRVQTIFPCSRKVSLSFGFKMIFNL